MPRRPDPLRERMEKEVKDLIQTSGLSEEDCHLLVYGAGEEYIVPILKKRLRTPEQKAYLDAADLSIEDCLNGRYTMEHADFIQQMYADWNTKLGRKMFGS